MHLDQKAVIEKNLEYVAEFLMEKKHRLLLKNHVVITSAGIDVRNIKGEFPVIHEGKNYIIEFSFSVSAKPQS
jgi:F420-0:gamma-glutamyl ligase